MTTEQFPISPKEEQGKLGAAYLKRIWSTAMRGKMGLPNSPGQIEHNYVSALFDSLGIGLEPTYQYLFSESPSFDAFEDWVLENGTISTDMVVLFNSLLVNGNHEWKTKKTENPILDTNALQKWEEDGYVIVKNAISKEDCETTVKAITDHLKIDLTDNSTWYEDHPSKQGIMVQLFNHAQLNKNRLSEKIRNAYRQLWERNDLMVSMDRVSFNPPENDWYKFPGPDLHWDLSLQTPIPFGVQGLLYLTDTPENQGAFTLVPEFHRKIESWLGSLPETADPRQENLHQLGARNIAAEAGDFIIWHHALPHGSSPNTGKHPRIVQYINYQPLDREIQSNWV